MFLAERSLIHWSTKATCLQCLAHNEQPYKHAVEDVKQAMECCVIREPMGVCGKEHLISGPRNDEVSHLLSNTFNFKPPALYHFQITPITSSHPHHHRFPKKSSHQPAHQKDYTLASLHPCSTRVRLFFTMTGRSQLAALLSSDQEPREASYRRACSEVLSSPEILTKLNNSNDVSFLLACLTDHGHRFTNLFSRLFAESNTRKRSFPVHRLASATSTLLTWIIRNFQDFNVDLLTSIISPALKTCLTSGVREGQSLATVLIHHEGIVKRLITTTGGAPAITSWTYSSAIRQQDADTLAAWTNQLADCVQLCPSVHGLRDELCRWEDLRRLMRCLRIDRNRHAEQTDTIKRAIHEPSFMISPDSTDLLNQFNLMIPESSRKLSEIIERLDITETIAILQVLAKSFPCNLCEDTLRRGAKIRQDNAATGGSHMVPMLRFDMEVFGHNCGSWEVLLSTPALSNLLTLRQSRSSGTIEEMLFMLANGQRHTAGLAGSKPIRQILKVPLCLNHCGLDRFIVWQVDVDIIY